MRLIILPAVASLAFAATQKDPPDCSSRPCTYTITCAARMCTAAEVREVQAALNDAHRGDTIKLQAGRIFPSTRSLQITRRPGDSGYLTITTTEFDRLPAPDTRITPAYAELLPTIAVSATNSYALGLAGNDRPAEYIQLVGLRFTSQVNTQIAVLMIGNDGNEFGWTFPERSFTPENQPDNIIVDRCLFDQDFSVFIRRLVQVNARRTVIRNSYLDGARELNSDTQSISAEQGVGPLIVENSYVGGATENLMFGGTGPVIPDAALSAEIRYNYFPKVEERMRFVRWRPGLAVFKGRIIRPSADLPNAPTYQARNSGVTGEVEPSWPTNPGATVNDNGVVWVLIGQGNARTVSKNNFEIKNARNVTVEYNVFDTHWFDTNQNNNIIFKLNNCPPKSSACDCVPEFTGRVNVNGRIVSSADGKPLPNLHAPATQRNVDPLVIRIDGVDYQIESFEPGDDYKILLRTDAGSRSNVAYTYGQPGCQAAWDRDIIFRHNIVRNGPTGISIATWVNGVRSRIGNISVTNNLFANLDCQRWSNFAGQCSNSLLSWYIFLAQLPPQVEFSNNTVIARNATDGIYLEGSNTSFSGDTKLLNNIFPRGSQSAMRGQGTGEGSVTLDAKLCGGLRCPGSQFNRNIIAGADLTRYQRGDNFNLCPEHRGCPVDFDFDDPRFGRLFENFGAGTLRVRPGHYAWRGGTDGRDIGVDWDRLPRIGNLRVVTTDRMALFTYEVTAPVAHIPCVIEVSAESDLSVLVPDLDPRRFLRPDTDQQPDGITRLGPQRMIRVGKNVPLEPARTYWYRLQCGGDAAIGSFATKPAGGQSQAVTLTHTPSTPGVAAVRIEFGYSYDSSADTILASQASSLIPCSLGAACEISLRIDPSQVLFYRTIELDANGLELARTPVMVTADGSAVFPEPKFSLNSIANSASGVSGGVAPCEIIAIFGDRLGPQQLVLPKDAPAGHTLGGVRLLFDRVAAPLLYVSERQIGAIAPARIQGRPLTEVQVEYAGRRSETVSVPVLTTRPGLFTVDLSGRGQARAVNHEDGALNGPESPAPRGSFVSLFGTAGGPLSPPCEEGKIAGGLQPLQLPVAVAVGGVPAEVRYAGSSPESIMGLLQIDIRIPENAPTGDAVPLWLAIGDVAAPEGVTLAVR